MCTSIVARKNARGKLESLTTPEEQQARIEALHHLTLDELNHCRRAVYHAVPQSLGDPEEALSAGLEIALKKYRGLGKLSAYVAACAHNVALLYYSRRVRRWLSFDEIIDADRHDENEDSAIELFGEDAPELSEPIDPRLIERIRQVLARMINYKTRHTRPTVIATAQRILFELCESANADGGVGVSEYDEAPLKAPDYRGQVHFDHNTKVARREMYRHLAERCGTDKYTVAYAMTALRKSTRIALQELDAER